MLMIDNPFIADEVDNPFVPRKLNVLSLFDGCSMTRVALDRAGIGVKQYIASEIDKYAIQVSRKNYPDIIQIGDVTKWESWNINWEAVDLIVAGFPCQSWSLAGQQKGERDPRGMLLYTMMDILDHIRKHNPNVKFLFENVKTKKEFNNLMDEVIGVKGIHINSALVSAQNRQRVYWTNISGVTQPEDRGLLLRDIIETADSITKNTCKEQGEKSVPIDANYYKGIYANQKRTAVCATQNRGEWKEVGDKALCITANYWKGADNHGQRTMVREEIDAIAFKEVRTEEAKKMRCEHMAATGKDFSPRRAKDLIPRDDGKANTLTTSAQVDTCILVGHASEINGHDILKRVYSPDGKCPTLNANGGGNTEPKVAIEISETEYGIVLKSDGNKASERFIRNVKNEDEKSNALLATSYKGEQANGMTNVQDKVSFYWRKLTPLECERLQTLPEGYTEEGVDNYYQKLHNEYTKYKNGGNEWLLFAESKNVIEQYVTNRQDIVINTTCDLLEQGQQMKEQKLIKKKNVLLTVVSENSKPLKICASCTINDLNEQEMLNLIFEKIKYVEYVERKQLQKSYVEITITTILGTEMLNIPIITEKELIDMDTKSHKENILLNIEKLQKILLVDHFQVQKLYIILIWLNRIITQTICISVPEVNTHYCIANLNALEQNCLNWDILSLKTEITKSISSSQRYKMIGNGFTVEVIAHILSFLKGEL